LTQVKTFAISNIRIGNISHINLVGGLWWMLALHEHYRGEAPLWNTTIHVTSLYL